MCFAVQSRWTKKSSLFAGVSDELLHLIQISLQRFAARWGEAIFGAGDASLKKLVAAEVAGGLQLLGVHAEVAVGSPEHAFQIVETQGVVDGEGADDAQAQALVNQAIELGQLAGWARRAGGGEVARGMGRS